MVTCSAAQIRQPNPSYPSTRIAVRLPSIGFHFSPARYHRLMQVAQIFQTKDDESSHILRPWEEADFEGWSSILSWKVSTFLHTTTDFLVANSLSSWTLVIYSIVNFMNRGETLHGSGGTYA